MSNSELLGSATISPDEAVCGQHGVWTITYTVGEQGLATGGGLRIHPPITTFSPIVRGDFWAMIRWHIHAVEVNSSPDTSFTARTLMPCRGYFFEGYAELAEVKNAGRRLEPGEQIEIMLSAQVQEFPMEEAGWHIEVDAEGAGLYSSMVHDDFPRIRLLEKELGLSKPPLMRVLSAAARRLRLTVFPAADLDGKFNLGLKAEDTYGNADTSFSGEIELAATVIVEGLPATVKFSREDRGVRVIGELNARESAQGRISATGPISGVSNPFRSCGHYNIYFGDIHAHSALSDGLASADDNYRYARDVGFVSVCALADHGPIKPEGIAAIERYNDPGHFVTLFGWEWEDPLVRHHKNIYYPDLAAVERLMPETPPLTPELFQYYAGEDVLLIPHHPNMATNFAWKQHNWRWHDDQTQRLVEICQILGAFETEESEGEGSVGNFKSSVRMALDMGHKLGFVGGTDNHRGQPAGPAYLSHPCWMEDIDFRGLTAFLAPDLTREAIWEALRARRTYATTGHRILLDFSVNGAIMGSEIISDDPPIIKAWAEGTDQVMSFDVIKNGEVVHSVVGAGAGAEITWMDEDYEPVVTSYYYVRVRQANGHMAWASPVWVSGSR